MLNLFNSIIPSTGITPLVFIILVLVSLVLGGIMALIHTYRNDYTKSFIMTLAILPAVICVVILMVNGNIGAGVAVAGTFSLVRFRSAPGTAKEIAALFLAMTAGLLTGMGHIIYAAAFAVIIGLVILICQATGFGREKNAKLHKNLRITIPEDLNYTEVFDDIFAKYTSEHDLVSAKTANMGSMFKLDYDITLNADDIEKEFIDELRCRNGNLEICISTLMPRETVEL